MKKVHEFCINNAIFIALFAFAVVVCSYVANFYAHNFSNSSGDWGTFGDFVGGTLNPLLSFLALIILLRTFSMQKTELDLQKEELKDTKELLKLQTQTQVKQQFESTFFALLNVHNQILESLSREPTPDLRDGKTYTNDSNLQKVLLAIRCNRELDLNVANSALKKQIYLCSHYLNVLYELLKFIEMNADDEKKYSNIIRALLPSEIMTLLAVYCYSQENEKYKLLIERYAIFENAVFKLDSNNDAYLAPCKVKEFYGKKAFGL